MSRLRELMNEDEEQKRVMEMQSDAQELSEEAKP